MVRIGSGAALGTTIVTTTAVAHSSGAIILMGSAGYICGTLGTIGASTIAALTAPATLVAETSVIALGEAGHIALNNEKMCRLGGGLMPVLGLIQHKVQVNTVRDNAVLSMIETIPYATDAPETVESYVVHLSTVQRAREMWDDSDPGSHLNDMVLDDGRTRMQCLPHVGKGRVWQVARYPLGSFLTCLCDRKISFIFGVVTKGILQFDRGP